MKRIPLFEQTTLKPADCISSLSSLFYNSTSTISPFSISSVYFTKIKANLTSGVFLLLSFSPSNVTFASLQPHSGSIFRISVNGAL